MIRFDKLLEIEESNKNTESTIKSSKIAPGDVPWIDKYRPKKINEVIYQDEVIKILTNVINTGNLPHLLFYGGPGTGKTSTILAIAKDLFGPNIFHDRVIELNASDERGISVVRNKIVTFAKTAIGKKDPDYPCPPFKIIILDEADAMTTEAQSALRKVIEDKSNITRFCFICNYINQIIDPIASRCVKIRFKPLSQTCVSTKLREIADKEKMQIDDDALDMISNASYGDMRKAIMLLQNLKYLDKDIKKYDVLEIGNYIPKDIIDNVIETCITKQSTVKEIVKLSKEIQNKSYPIYNILLELNRRIIETDQLTDKQKASISLRMSTIERRLIDGANEHIQFLSLLLFIKN